MPVFFSINYFLIVVFFAWQVYGYVRYSLNIDLCYTFVAFGETEETSVQGRFISGKWKFRQEVTLKIVINKDYKWL